MSVIYRGIISVADKFVPSKLRPLWNHPAGRLAVLMEQLRVDRWSKSKGQNSYLEGGGWGGGGGGSHCKTLVRS